MHLTSFLAFTFSVKGLNSDEMREWAYSVFEMTHFLHLPFSFINYTNIAFNVKDTSSPFDVTGIFHGYKTFWWIRPWCIRAYFILWEVSPISGAALITRYFYLL